VRSLSVVVRAVLSNGGAGFVQQSGFIERDLFSEGTVHALIAAIRLGVMRVRAHVGRPGGLNKLSPLMPDELGSAIMHDLGFARPAGPDLSKA